MKKKKIISSIFFSLALTLGAGCGKEKTKETGFIIETDDVKLIYKLGEEIDLEGLKVFAAKEVGTYSELDDDDFEIIHTYNKDVLGSYKVEVKYKKFPVKYFYVEVEKFDREALPTMPEANITIESITMENVLGVEYRIDNLPYQDMADFTGLQPGSTHTIHARYKETDTYFASEEISKTFTLPLGPASMSLTLGSDSLLTIYEFMYFDLSITPKDNKDDTGLYIQLLAPGLTDAKFQYQAGSVWVDLEDNIYAPEEYSLKEETIKFRVNNQKEEKSTITAKLFTQDDQLIAASNVLDVEFMLGSAKATIIKANDAVVNEPYEFLLDVKLNNDTHLKDEVNVYGQITYHTSQIPNTEFYVEFYDESSQTWKMANRANGFKFKTDGMNLDNVTYTFRFTPIGQTYTDFTYTINFIELESDTVVLSEEFKVDVIDLATVKGNALLEIDNSVNLEDYSGETLETVQGYITQAKSDITNSTKSSEIADIIKGFKQLIESL